MIENENLNEEFTFLPVDDEPEAIKTKLLQEDWCATSP